MSEPMPENTTQQEEALIAARTLRRLHSETEVLANHLKSVMEHAYWRAGYERKTGGGFGPKEDGS